MTDNLTAELAAIRHRAEIAYNDYESPPKADIDALLAIADAVLELHQPGRVIILGALCPKHESHRFLSITSTEAAGITDCPDCEVTVSKSCTGCGPQVRLDSCVTRAAITSALSGTEGPS